MRPRLLIVPLLLSLGVEPCLADAHPNVLFIAVDDLRPELSCYGKTHIKSPNIDELAARGVVFTRAYCQMASCCPSRTSLLTGLRPNQTKVFGNHAHFRENLPHVVTLPQHFRRHGYHTQSFGKVFHAAYETAHGGRTMDDDVSWSVPTWLGSPRNYFSPAGIASARREFARESRKSGAALEDWINQSIRTLATEAPDVADDVLYDGAMTNVAISELNKLRTNGKPFFLAVGFTRPHLPFVAPKKYWDLYDPAAIELSNHDSLPQDAPAIASSPSELRNYSGMPRSGPLADAQARQVKHGYYACVSFVDALVGRLLDELDRLGLRDETIVVLWGDHGWHLGELGLWGKNTNFESATRVPLIVFDPRSVGVAQSARGAKAQGMVELIDVYPTLCELAGLPVPEHVSGLSFTSQLHDPLQAGKSAAISQHPRPGFTNFTSMGHSIRTDRYRLTIWQSVVEPATIEAVELYDYQTDPLESKNIADRVENVSLVAELIAQLRREIVKHE